jgi:hypothetical protein
MDGQNRWTHRPEGSNWGDFGADDQIGRLNLLTAERVRRAVAQVREGRTFCLSLPLDYPGGSVLAGGRWPPRLSPTQINGDSLMNWPYSRTGLDCTDVISDDAVALCLQYSTQWDSLAHAGALFDADGDGVAEVCYYNGYRGGEHVTGPYDYLADKAPTGQEPRAHALGIEKMAESCVQGRGVMIDLEAHLGRDYRPVAYDDLQRILDADGVVIEEGDMVCLRTGFDRQLLGWNRSPPADARRHCVGLDGRDPRLLRWITDSGLAVLISDNFAVEFIHHDHPPGLSGCAHLPLHEHCLFKLGIHLGEMFLLSDLADWLRAHGRNRFLLTAPPLRLPGAVGSPPAPVATV